MTELKPDNRPRAAALRPSSVIMIVALIDLLVIAPYSYWRFSGNRTLLIIVGAVEGVLLLSLLGTGLYLRRRGS